MTAAAKKILDQALALSEEDRERVAEVLLATLGREPRAVVEQAWDAEVSARIESAGRGEGAPREWDQVAQELRAKHSLK